jgi:hypothetical protein
MSATTNIYPATSNYAIKSAHRRIKEAWQQLKRAGFDIKNHERNNDWPWLLKAARWFNATTLWKVFRLAEIISAEQPLTVRRCMYVGIGTLFQDSSGYDSCQRLVLRMRRADLVPFEYITDPTRERIKPAMWRDLADYADWVAAVYQKDLWQNQDTVIEVFIEKEAMVGVVEPETDGLRVSLIPARGQCSETWCWSIAQDWNKLPRGVKVKVYYIGDHDPAGFSIEASMRARIEGYLDEDHKDRFAWVRLAVTHDDFRQRNVAGEYELLGFPVKAGISAKIRDAYIAQYGDRCVEADAISPIEIRHRVREAIQRHIDLVKWETMLEIEAREKIEVQNLLARP